MLAPKSVGQPSSLFLFLFCPLGQTTRDMAVQLQWSFHHCSLGPQTKDLSYTEQSKPESSCSSPSCEIGDFVKASSRAVGSWLCVPRDRTCAAYCPSELGCLLCTDIQKGLGFGQRQVRECDTDTGQKAPFFATPCCDQTTDRQEHKGTATLQPCGQ